MGFFVCPYFIHLLMFPIVIRLTSLNLTRGRKCTLSSKSQTLIKTEILPFISPSHLTSFDQERHVFLLLHLATAGIFLFRKQARLSARTQGHADHFSWIYLHSRNSRVMTVPAVISREVPGDSGNLIKKGAADCSVVRHGG